MYIVMLVTPSDLYSSAKASAALALYLTFETELASPDDAIYEYAFIPTPIPER